MNPPYLLAVFCHIEFGVYQGKTNMSKPKAKWRHAIGITSRVPLDHPAYLSELTNRDYRVARRNARGQFSKRGHFYQPIKKGGKH
jgi:hypothetical protein